MAFEVQTQAGTLTANAYCSVQFFKDYHSDRGNTIPSTAGNKDIERAIVRASDYLDGRFNFIGEKVQTEQRLKWPRLDAEDRFSRVRFGVPHEVQEACADYALISLSSTLNPTPTRDDTGRVVQSKFEKTDVLEERTVYVDGGRFEMPRYPVADNKLKSSGLVVRGVEIRRA